MTTVAELQELMQRAVLISTRRAFFQDLADRHDVVRGVQANILGRAAPPLVPVVIETTAEQRLGGTVWAEVLRWYPLELKGQRHRTS